LRKSPKLQNPEQVQSYKNKMAAKVRVVMLALKSWLGDKLSEGAEIRLSEVMKAKLSEGMEAKLNKRMGSKLSEGLEVTSSMGNGAISCKGMKA
jgi:hypothetical protein